VAGVEKTVPSKNLPQLIAIIRKQLDIPSGHTIPQTLRAARECLDMPEPDSKIGLVAQAREIYVSLFGS
jgi:hypothetical protein